APRDALRLLPSREQFVRVWRRLERETTDGALSGAELPLLRSLAAELGGAECFLRAAVCLDVFEERGLLRCSREDDVLTLRMTANGKKVELEASAYVRRLRSILQ
nr:single-stranded-DNA-specific exonuclease RecJ [Oscillospiraceae bacterium]